MQLIPRDRSIRLDPGASSINLLYYLAKEVRRMKAGSYMYWFESNSN